MVRQLSELELGISLPPNYSVEQEEDSIVLKNQDDVVARMSSWNLDIKNLEKEAWDHHGLVK